MNFINIIKRAGNLIHSKQLKDGLIGDVGCILISSSGKEYSGICVGVNSNTYCAERVAISKMISEGNEYEIDTIVAVWKNENNQIYVIPPCGHCRQAMKEIDEQNITTTKVILDSKNYVYLKELLPYYDWWKKID